MRRVFEKTNPFYDTPRFAFGFEFIDNGARVLDYGCGDGWFGQNLLKWKEVKYYGVDKDADIMAGADERISVQTISDTLPFPSEFFDVATIFEVLEHVHDQDRVLREIHRVLKPGGVLIASTPRKNVFSFLDAANWKFMFPRAHRLYYTLRHGREAYEYRYAKNPYGLVGNIEKEKSWHQHFTEAEMRSLVTRTGFQLDEMDSAGFLTPLMEILGVIPPLNFLFPQRVRNWDSYRFGQRMLFCKAKKIPN